MKNNDNKKFWDRVARLYTKMQGKSNEEQYKKTLDIVETYLVGDDRVLELAAGTGQLSFPLCDKVAYYEATDFSSNMIEEAKKIRNEGIVFATQDATHLTYDDEIFDVVIIANALHIMPDPTKALSEIYRVLKVGGRLIAPTFIYEGKLNKFKLKVMEIAGFKTFTKWTRATYMQQVSEIGFDVISSDVIEGKLAPECVLVAVKI